MFYVDFIDVDLRINFLRFEFYKSLSFRDDRILLIFSDRQPRRDVMFLRRFGN